MCDGNEMHHLFLLQERTYCPAIGSAVCRQISVVSPCSLESSLAKVTTFTALPISKD